MKKQAMSLMISTVLMALTASAATVEIRPVEAKKMFETRVTEGSKEIQTAEAKQKFVQTVGQEFTKLTSGKVATNELSAALNAKLNVNENGQARQLSMVKIAKSISDAAKVSTEVRSSSMDAKTQQLIEQKERALNLAPQFLALASVVSKAGGKADAGLNGFAKQLSLIPETLTSMDVDAVRAHNEIMELAIEAKKKNPEMNGDEAFVEALKQKFGEKADQKLADVNGCARGFVL